MPITISQQFSTDLSDLLDNISTVASWFADTFIAFADMLFNSPFVLYIGLGIITAVLAIVAAFLRIKRGA